MPSKLLLGNVMLSVFLYSGALFGWAPLQQILLSEHNGRGQFDNLCLTNTTKFPCTEQSARLNLVYTLGTFTLSLVSLPGGWFLDTYGVRATVFLSGLFTISGFVLFGFSDSDSFDGFIYGAVLIATGGFLVMVSAFPASFLFPKWQTVILAAVSCLFDASSLTFAVFAPLIQYVKREQLFLYYACFAALVYASLIFQWSLVSNEDDNKNQNNNSEVDHEKQLEDSLMERSEEEEDPQVDHSPMWDLTVSQQLRSFEFFFIAAFCSVQQLRANTYIGLNDDILIEMGDKDGHYINIFSYALPAGIVFIPLIDFAVTKLGLVGALHSTNLLGVLYGSLVLIKSLPLQLVTFLAFTGYRAFLYSVMSAFNAKIFGLRTLGRLTGFVFTSSAIFQLLQYPIALVGHKYPFWTQLGLVLSSFFVIPLVLFFQCKNNAMNISSSIINTNVHSPLISPKSPTLSSSASTRKLERGSTFLRSPSKNTSKKYLRT
jgi:MFS transporter, LAT3 family, solute carrier family 43, member 3